MMALAPHVKPSTVPDVSLPVTFNILATVLLAFLETISSILNVLHVFSNVPLALMELVAHLVLRDSIFRIVYVSLVLKVVLTVLYLLMAMLTVLSAL